MSADFPIRLATLDDAVDIAVLSRDLVEQGLPWSWTPQQVARAIAGAHTNVALARRGGELAGVGIMTYADAVAHLKLLAVREKFRRRGLATGIVQWLEEVARAAGIASIRVEARADNAPAISLYALRGYRERERVLGMYSGMDDGIRFEKALRAVGAPDR
jgi:ribosomal protein S18 acetylase RimI-like enzyme